MKTGEMHSHTWEGKSLKVRIPFTRAGVAQHVLITHGDTTILVDAGDGVLRDLLAESFRPERLAGILFTHGHFDHMGGIHSLLGFLRMVGRREVLQVYMPEGCTEVYMAIDTFRKCYPDSLTFGIKIVELQPGETVSVSQIEIRTYEAVHCGSIKDSEVLDRIPALAYRFHAGGESVAVTGDTGRCPSLNELATGVDLAVIEATYQTSSGKSRELIEKVHLSEDIAHEIGKLAKSYVLVHKGRRE